MASRTSLTGVAVSDGYDQLLHVSDSDGLHATTLRQIYDGDGTASCLYLATETAKFIIGVDSGDDLIVNDGTNNIFLIEGDTTRFTFRCDGGGDSDFAITNAATDMVRVESDTDITLTPTRALAVVLGGSAGEDFTVNDGTANILHISSDLRDFVVTLATGGGNDFRVNNGSDDLILIQGDGSSVTFDLGGGAGGDLAVTDGTTNMLLIQTDDDTVDIVGHDLSAKGLMLAGTLITASAAELNKLDGLAATMAEINIACDVLTEAVTTTNPIAASESGTHFVLNSATAFVSTLPAVAAGLEFWFHAGVTQVTGGNHTVVTNASANIIMGSIACGENDQAKVVIATAADSINFIADLMVHGDHAHVWCDGTYWFLDGVCVVQDGMTTTQT